MHGIGKGRKLGARNKSRVERLVDMVVSAAGHDSSVVVDLLEEHWNMSHSRLEKGQDPIRNEFADGNKVLDRYLRKSGMGHPIVRDALKQAMDVIRKPPTLTDIDRS